MANKLWDSRRKALQQTLKSLRIDSGITQQQLSTMLEKPQSYVSKYESGERRLDFVEVEDICAALGLSLNQFVITYQNKTIGPATLTGYTIPASQDHYVLHESAPEYKKNPQDK